MRPNSSDAFVSRSRKSSSAGDSVGGNSLRGPASVIAGSSSDHLPPQQAMSYSLFMTDPTLSSASVDSSCSSRTRPKDSSSQVFGVQSLDNSFSADCGNQPKQSQPTTRRQSSSSSGSGPSLRRKQHGKKRSNDSIKSSFSACAEQSASSATERVPSSNSPPNADPVVPVQTSLDLEIPPDQPGSLAPSPEGISPFIGSPLLSSKSYAPSEDDQSQAMLSGEEDEPSGNEVTEADNALDLGGVAPQLIMPTIRMPSRRPFTDRGKSIGRIKVLIAGDSGIGKTSLINAIFQSAKDIVHVDPITSMGSITSSSGPSPYSIQTRGSSERTQKITEVFASTKPYPHWWSDVEESRVLRRRKSGTDIVLERNLCFVDTPGYGFGTSFLDCVEPVTRFVESQLEAVSSTITGEGDLLGLVSGYANPQVHLVLYCILHRLKPVDIEYIRKLSAYTNVMPIITQSDVLSPQQIKDLKASVLFGLQSSGIKPFTFRTQDLSSDDSSLTASAPFAVSSAPSSDTDNMDASILMSPDYTPPLLPSELDSMIAQLFTPDNITWLRHAASKKYVTWRLGLNKVSGSVYSLTGPLSPVASPFNQLSRSSSPASLRSSSHSGLIHVPPLGYPTSYALARVTDHTLREDKLAEVRLQRWAVDLQRSLTSERERFEKIARGERALWLTERLQECVVDGSLVPMRTSPLARVAGEDRKGYWQLSPLDRRDPLGFVKLSEELKRNAKYLNSAATVGSVAGLAVAVTAYIGLWLFRPELLQEWRESATKYVARVL